MGNLTGKVALITGSGDGMGRAHAVLMASRGADIVVNDIRPEMAEETARMVRAVGRKAHVVACDVADVAAVRGLAESGTKALGRVDILVNNAGITEPHPLLEMTPEEWDKTLNINLRGMFFCTQQAFGLMKRQTPKGGRIINNGSISAHVPRPQSAPYTATKHAITGLTKSTSLDGRAHDIACGQIDIGNAGTEMTGRMSKGVPQADGRVAVEPTMDVAHVARAVLYMASLPLDANVQFMTVMATKMPFIGRG